MSGSPDAVSGKYWTCSKNMWGKVFKNGSSKICGGQPFQFTVSHRKTILTYIFKVPLHLILFISYKRFRFMKKDISLVSVCRNSAH